MPPESAMRIFVPSFVVATLQPPQTALRSKLGGLPWGFPAESWPVCAECGGPMVLLAQLPQDAAIGLDLGGEDHVLHLFQCPAAGCSSYEYESGCNASLVLRRAELGDGLTPSPGSDERFPPPVMNGELWIAGWHERDDGITPDLRDAFFDPDKYWDFASRSVGGTGGDAVPRRRERTKVGGFPEWGNHGVVLPNGTFEFLLQLDTFLPVEGQLPKPEQAGCSICSAKGSVTAVPADMAKPNAPLMLHEGAGETGYSAEFANFGTDGTAYVFIDRRSMPPLVIWAWTR